MVINVLGNKIEFVILHYATILLGATSVPLSNNLSNEKIKFYLGLLKSKIIFTDKKNFQIEGYSILVVEDFKEFIKLISRFSKNNQNDDVEPNQLVSIMFTSGSSGQLKGVMLSHKSVSQSIKNITGYVGYDNLNKEVIPSPLHHNFGLGHLYCTHFGGGAVYLTNGIKSLKNLMHLMKNTMQLHYHHQ